MLGIRTTIVMPEDAPKSKLNNKRWLAGDVVIYDRYTGDPEVIARRLAAEQGAALVPFYDHDHIIVGQGTIGIEIADDARRLGLLPELVLIPCGGLSSGCAVALKLRMSRYWVI